MSYFEPEVKVDELVLLGVTTYQTAKLSEMSASQRWPLSHSNSSRRSGTLVPALPLGS